MSMGGIFTFKQDERNFERPKVSNNKNTVSARSKNKESASDSHSACTPENISALTVISHKEASLNVTYSSLFSENLNFCQKHHTIVAPHKFQDIEKKETFGADNNVEAREIIRLLFKKERLKKKKELYLSQLNFKENIDKELLDYFDHAKSEIDTEIEFNFGELFASVYNRKVEQDKELTANILNDLMRGDF